MREEPLRLRLDRRRQALLDERQDWEAHWRDLADYILPRRGRHLMAAQQPGQAINTRIIDGTATFAARTLASGLMSGVTSPSRPWFRLTTRDPALAERPSVRLWLHHVEQRLRSLFAGSNVYSALHTSYEDLAVFGTSAILLMGDDRDVMRAYALPMGSYSLSVGPRGVVDTLYREVEMTVLEMVTRFGLNVVSPTVRSLYDQGRESDRVTVWHAIEPRWDRNPKSAEAIHKPYRSVYWEAGGHQDSLLHEGGYDRFPVVAPRWAAMVDEAYGRSPGMDALGDVKQLQLEQRRKAQAIDKMVNPPMVAPVSLQHAHATLLPGGITYVQDTDLGGAAFRPAYQVQPRLNEMAADINEVQQRINRAFYADLFLMLAETDRRQMTAREITERRSEKMLALGPVLERLQGELLEPLLDIAFYHLGQASRLPPVPEDLQGQELGLDLQSMLARDQRIDAITAIERLMAMAGTVGGVAPETFDKLDPDRIVDEYADLIGVPPTVLRSTKEAEKLREDRAQAAQAAQVGQTGGNPPAGLIGGSPAGKASVGGPTA